MDNQTFIKAIAFFQETHIFHSLTCGNDSRHTLLRGEEVDGVVILKCPDCDYTQSGIPDVVDYVWENQVEIAESSPMHGVFIEEARKKLGI